MAALYDMSDAIESMAEDVTIIRRPAATLDQDGYATQAADTMHPVRAVVVPEPSLANDEQRSDAGAFSTDRLAVFAIGFAVETSAPDKRGDRIVYGGKTYEAADSLDWSRLGGFGWCRFEVVDTRVES